THETLYNYELGYSFNYSKSYLTTNIYYMDYNNQLVLTGQINDVGSPVMTNVEKSYRSGIELSAGVKPWRIFQADVNVTLSENKIKNFTEYIDNWDTGDQSVVNLGTTDISFSPSIVANSDLMVEPVKNLRINFITKYVGKQYIDNTSTDEKSLNPYLVSDLKLSYSIKIKGIDELSFNLLINNLFNHEYESNAWVYSYIYENREYSMDGYFPQAGINIMGGIRVRF
ncbi:MAG: TonB-dependent receptor, partial [Bacteroidales bacterium]|nr:TonB-dependent receptor [Bacteroidales bacterium]